MAFLKSSSTFAASFDVDASDGSLALSAHISRHKTVNMNDLADRYRCGLPPEKWSSLK